MNRYQGMTLVEVLIMVMALSLFAIMYATSEPDIAEERQAGLTVSRTYDLLKAGHLYYEENSLAWPDEDELSGFLFGEPVSLSNGFGEPYVLEADGGQLMIYQLVPSKWAGYIMNHLERTQVLSLEEASNSSLGGNYPRLNQLYDRGYTAIVSSINGYGNLHFAFVRRQFESFGIFEDEDRKDVTAGGTYAVIYQPDCGSLQPFIHYTVRGACSFYPRNYYEQEVRDGFWGYVEVANPPMDPRRWYTTSGYKFPVVEKMIGDDRVWVISVKSYENWYTFYTEEVPDGDDSTRTVYHYTPQQGLSPSQEVCVGNRDNRYKDDDLDKQADPTIDNSEFNDNARLLYVDAWVSCQ